MPRPPSDDGYDSDSGSEPSVTDVHLGVADGSLENDDESNPLVSRIGGRAAWLPLSSVPPKEVTRCANCKQSMQLLVQIFAPLVDSPFDRSLLVWGCARPTCQRINQGSLKAIRVLKHNPRWAAKLEKKRLRREAREARIKEQEARAKAKAEEEERKAKINPFSSKPTQSVGGGLGGMLFGADTFSANTNPFAPNEPSAEETATLNAEEEAEDDDDDDDDESVDESDDEDQRLAEEMEIKAAIADKANKVSDWVKTVSKYPPQYISTIPEPSLSTKEEDKKLTATQAKALKPDQEFSQEELQSFAKEGYEKMMLDGVDDVFEKFVKRVGVEGSQVVRYEFGGVPLPFHGRGSLYKKLWPKAKRSGPTSEGYNPSCIPPCPACGSSRTFEVQLMPNLVNILRAETIKKGEEQTEDDEVAASSNEDEKSLDAEAKRRAEIERYLGRKLPAQPSEDGIIRSNPSELQDSSKSLPSRTGLIWSTAVVYVCEKDCCIPRQGHDSEGETWREEWIGAQFEDEK
ncbi:hypothetical protein IE53DRAFT_386929 [Violaceomyces palustris]|uniref:Uncharacterized protein n=1 Tax=Violaceomyces palustris TaxID=1673888 RepID=A0ACD0NY31_9BASI|nr:hypothetical protein IE53DRAFT_386929 [Violaceomyces palustris]